MSDNNMNKDHKGKQADQTAANSQSNDKQAGVTNKMQTVKSAWDKAPEGTKKANALKHYQSAEKAQKSGNDTEAMRELEEATRALG